MRTTINVDDDVFERISNYAASRSLSLGKAVSELVRKALESRTPVRRLNGTLVFDLPAGSQRVSSKPVKNLLDED